LSCLQRICIRYRSCVVCSEIVTHCWSCIVCSEFMIRCRKCVFCSKFVIHCRNWVVCNELVFTAELCVLQRIWDEVVLSAVNQHSLPKLCCLQGNYDSLLESSCLQRINIHCNKCGGCSEVAFTAEIVAPATKQFLLPNCAACSEPVFAAKLYGLQWISFRCWFLQ
jgi:hypothetical protein